MANTNHCAVQAPETEVKLLTGNFTTSASNPTVKAGFIKSITRNSAGEYAIILRKKYPALLQAEQPVIISTTNARVAIEAIDVKAGTMTVQVYDSAGAAADLAGAVVYLGLKVRNSTSRRG